MFKHLTFEGVEKKDNKECNIQEKAIIMKEKVIILIKRDVYKRQELHYFQKPNHSKFY